jgi:hypothetical protein
VTFSVTQLGTFLTNPDVGEQPRFPTQHVPGVRDIEWSAPWYALVKVRFAKFGYRTVKRFEIRKRRARQECIGGANVEDVVSDPFGFKSEPETPSDIPRHYIRPQ